MSDEFTVGIAGKPKILSVQASCVTSASGGLPRIIVFVSCIRASMEEIVQAMHG